MARRGARHSAQAVVTSTSRKSLREQRTAHTTRSTGSVRSAFKTLSVVSIAGALSFTMAVPAYAAPVEDQALAAFSDTVAVQELTVAAADDSLSLAREAVNAEEVPVPVTTTRTATTTTATEQTAAVTPVAIPNGVGSAGLLAAAMAQLGVRQDCTAMVENALRAIGYSVGDLGPMGFGGYGRVIDPSEAGPGDIMMRAGHVAIYAGDGMAVHGGWTGYTTVYTGGAISSPYNYSVIIRVGG